MKYNILRLSIITLLLVTTVIYIYYQYINFEVVEEVDYTSFMAEILMTSTIFVSLLLLCFSAQSRSSNSYLLIGFTFLFFSLLTDSLDEFFLQPQLMTQIVEDVFQVIGFILVLLGIRYWNEANKLLYTNLEGLSRTDTLTWMFNRRYFDEKIIEEFNRCKRYKGSFGLLMIDIDHFKEVNDTYGHDVGDEVLREFTDVIRFNIREIDMLARWGGEEFAVLLVDSNIEDAHSMAEKIRSFSEALTVSIDKNKIKFTVSIGCSELSINDSIESMLKRADQCLYQAKNEGRNRVC